LRRLRVLCDLQRLVCDNCDHDKKR